jgi:hypothetical protein
MERGRRVQEQGEARGRPHQLCRAAEGTLRDPSPIVCLAEGMFPALHPGPSDSAAAPADTPDGGGKARKGKGKREGKGSKHRGGGGEGERKEGEAQLQAEPPPKLNKDYLGIAADYRTQQKYRDGGAGLLEVGAVGRRGVLVVVRECVVGCGEGVCCWLW